MGGIEDNISDKREEIRKGLEKVIFYVNKILHDWDTVKGKKNYVKDYTEVRSIVRSNIRRYLNGIVPYTSLSSFEFDVEIKNLTIISMKVYTLRRGAYNRFGNLEEILNRIINTIDYEDLKYSIAKDEWRRFNTVSNDSLSIVDINKLQSFKF